MAQGRGVYRGLHSSLFDDPDDYHRLTPYARLVLLTARLCKQAGPAAIFRYYPGTLAIQTGLSALTVMRCLGELAKRDYVEYDDAVLWIKRGLRYDPHVKLADKKHRATILKALAELPKRAIVLNFCDFYEIPRAFDGPSEGQRTLGYRDRVPSTEEDRVPSTDTDTEKPTTTTMSSPRGAAPPPVPILPDAKDWAEAKWPSPEALAHLYNELAPDNVPEVETLSPERRKKAAHHLKAFPSRDWWLEVFSEYRASKFLSGQTAPKAGHENFHPDFDWLLANGKKDHVENAVKVHDGFYR